MPKSEPPQANKTGIPPWPHEQKLIFPSPLQSAIAYLICCPARRCQQQCRPTPAGTDSGAGISQILLVQINQKRMSPPQTQTQPKRPAPKKLFAACLFRLSVALPLAPSSPFFPTNWPLTASHTHAHKHSRNTSSSDIFCLLLCGKPLTSGSFPCHPDAVRLRFRDSAIQRGLSHDGTKLFRHGVRDLGQNFPSANQQRKKTMMR